MDGGPISDPKKFPSHLLIDILFTRWDDGHTSAMSTAMTSAMSFNTRMEGVCVDATSTRETSIEEKMPRNFRRA
jgi:hypothetical protein